jgi:3-oxoacyl-[acyl-carrier protein] reductase
MLQSRLLKGKVVLITGCNRGIGKSMVERFAEEGATIYACARQEGSLDILAADMSKKYSTIISQNYFDVNDKNGVKKVFTKIFKEQNRLDSIINNAGIMQDALLGMVSESLLAGLFSTNVFSVIGFIQYASKIMKRNNGGSIVNISSVVGTRGNAGQIAYSATKGAIVSITKTAAKELAQYNIRVNAIAPGMIDTDLLSNIDPNVKEKLKNSIRMGRIGKPEDISNVAVFLASDLSEYLTGQILEVDGSWEM